MIEQFDKRNHIQHLKNSRKQLLSFLRIFMLDNVIDFLH